MSKYDLAEQVWKDAKGRELVIRSLSDKWLNNIRKMFRGTDREKIKFITDEINRRKKLRKQAKKA